MDSLNPSTPFVLSKVEGRTSLRVSGRLILFFFLLHVAAPATAVEPSSDYILQMARVDFLLRKKDYPQAARELGQVPKELHDDPLFRKYADRVIAALYHRPQRGLGVAGRLRSPDVIQQRLRVTRHKMDAESGSDQGFDSRGWQVNERLVADVAGRDGIRAKFQADLEGYKNGHNDVRYRTLLADFYEEDSHVAFGDTATYPSPYFLRGSRLRGVNVILSGELNEFQALAGAYPVWLEGRDEYVYPRTVFGIRDRWNTLEDRVRIGINFVNTRDSEKIRTEDGANPQAPVSTANQVRDNFVYSLDQEIKLIPDTWFLKAAEAYSYTDDSLLENQFGENTKLKDSSFLVESLFIQPWVRSTTRMERTGPDFRLSTDFPSGAVNHPKGLTSDRQRIEQSLDFRPMGPFDLDLQGSWIRNNLDNDNTVEQTRQSWYTALLGIRTPRNFPRPRFRGTIMDTVSVPGSETRPAQTRRYDLRGELSHTYEGIYATAFADYRSEVPTEDKDKPTFSTEEWWSFGTRLSTTLLERILASPHYTYKITDEDFDVRPVVDRQIIPDRVKGTHHEAGLSTSTRLWSTSSLGLSYTYLRGKLANPDATGPLVPTSAHTGTVNFHWPYNRYSWNKKRKWSVFPGVTCYFADLAETLEKRPLVTGRLTTGYEVFDQWKVELMGEARYDEDNEFSNVQTEEYRFWLLWTSQWK